MPVTPKQERGGAMQSCYAYLRLLMLLCVVFALESCSMLLSCRLGEKSAVMDSAYFGTDQPTGIVTPQQWQQFIDEVVTPRFPQGLTSWQAAGQWKSSGEIKQEVSNILNIVHPNDEKSDEALREIVDEYKARFQQDAVLRIRARACMSL